jgi:hypothetical protein
MTIIGSIARSVADDLLSMIKFKKFMIWVAISNRNIQLSTIVRSYPSEIKIIPKGITVNNGRKLKNGKTDLPNT